MSQTSENQSVDRLRSFLTTHFGDQRLQLRSLVRRYKQLYSLPQLSHTFDCPASLFERFLHQDNFVVVAAYNPSRQIAVLPPRSKHKLYGSDYFSPYLIGKAIADREFSTYCLEEMAGEMVQRFISSEVIELVPVAFVKNIFHCNGNTKEHEGIAYIACVGENFPKSSSGDFEFVSEPPPKMFLQNADIFRIALEALNRKTFAAPIAEVEAAHRHSVAEFFHKYFVKRALYSRSSAPIRAAVKKHMGVPESYLDVSCGDDELIIEISEEFDPAIVVANDISWRSMARVRDRAASRNFNVLFTNHNISELPFAFEFDVVVCKNTLHHIGTIDEMENVVRRLKEISKRLILVDIEDPKRSLRGRAMNFYYERIYGDAGVSDHRFFTRTTFRNFVEAAFRRQGRRMTKFIQLKALTYSHRLISRWWNNRPLSSVHKVGNSSFPRASPRSIGKYSR